MNFSEWSLITTATCSLGCGDCGQGALRRCYPDYELSLATLTEFLESAEARGVLLQRVGLTGGEPTEWSLYDRALDLLAESPAVRGIELITNGSHPEAVLRHAARFVRVRVTCYKAHRKQIEELTRRWPGPGKLVRWGAGHVEPPRKPIAGTLPAACTCGKPVMYARRIYACAPAPDRLVRLGLSLDDPRFSCRLDDDWPAWLRDAIPGRTKQPLCEICISNKNVSRGLPLSNGPE